MPSSRRGGLHLSGRDGVYYPELARSCGSCTTGGGFPTGHLGWGFGKIRAERCISSDFRYWWTSGFSGPQKGITWRWFHTSSVETLTPSASAALETIRSSFEKSLQQSSALQSHAYAHGQKSRLVPAGAHSVRPRRQLSRKERRAFQGHLRRYQLMGDKPEFHHVDRNINDHIFEPTDNFLLRITTSKNNCHVQLLNKSNGRRTIFGSFAGKSFL